MAAVPCRHRQRLPVRERGAAFRRGAVVAAGRERFGKVDGECGYTPWDPKLRDAFNRRRLIVHEEFLLDHLLDHLLDEFNALATDR